MVRFVLTLGRAVLSFTLQNDPGPYPFLNGISGIRIAARAGSASTLGSTETPSATVRLDNDKRRAAQLIGNPVRARGEIFDGEDLAFSGIVTGVRYSRNIEIRLES